MKKTSLADRFRIRTVDLKKDKPLLLSLECELNYEQESHLKARFDFEEYRRRWHSHDRPKKIHGAFKTACRDKRTICEFLETPSSEPAGFILVTFQEVKGFDCVSAFLEDISIQL
jgi:hypothetical protein